MLARLRSVTLLGVRQTMAVLLARSSAKPHQRREGNRLALLARKRE